MAADCQLLLGVLLLLLPPSGLGQHVLSADEETIPDELNILAAIGRSMVTLHEKLNLLRKK